MHLCEGGERDIGGGVGCAGCMHVTHVSCVHVRAFFLHRQSSCAWVYGSCGCAQVESFILSFYQTSKLNYEQNGFEKYEYIYNSKHSYLTINGDYFYVD